MLVCKCKYQPLANLSFVSIYHQSTITLICMLRMLVVFFVWEVEGFRVLGLTLNVAAFSLCIRGMLTQWITLLYILLCYNQVPGKCSFKPGSLS